MFSKNDSSGYKEVLAGVRLKTLAYGEKTLLCKFLIDKGATIPDHQHVHEQTGYLVSGVLNFSVDGKAIRASDGDSWSIPTHVPHGATALEDSVVIEVFSPVREEYLP